MARKRPSQKQLERIKADCRRVTDWKIEPEIADCKITAGTIGKLTTPRVKGRS
jgi:hypothetical protein